MKALGFIETKGLTGNIEATDALLKAANVEFLGSNTGIGSGLTTVVVTGDVGAVEAAVAAAKTASAKVGEFMNRKSSCRPAFPADVSRMIKLSSYTPAASPVFGRRLNTAVPPCAAAVSGEREASKYSAVFLSLTDQERAASPVPLLVSLTFFAPGASPYPSITEPKSRS